VPDFVELGSYCGSYGRIVVTEVENTYPTNPVDEDVAIYVSYGGALRRIDREWKGFAVIYGLRFE